MDHTAREKNALGGENRFTEAELLAVQHALDAEMLGLKKCMHYANEINDEQAKSLLMEQADIHHRRMDMMLSLLDAPGDVTKQAKLLLQTAGTQGGNQYA